MSDNQGPAAEPGAGSRKRGQRKAHNQSKGQNKNKAVVLGALSATLLLAAGAGMVSAASILPSPSGSKTLDMTLADVPAGRTAAVCPAPPHLAEGTSAGTDSQFSPVSRSAKSFLDAVVLSDAGGSVPGSNLASLGGSAIADIAKLPPPPSPCVRAPVLNAGVVASGLRATSPWWAPIPSAARRPR
ncbi:conserved hypothetical protein [Arthrobacter sp. Hiyo8]|nr:conserved hypothetical protein [Arthrobacter sp. Hiyo8]